MAMSLCMLWLLLCPAWTHCLDSAQATGFGKHDPLSGQAAGKNEIKRWHVQTFVMETGKSGGHHKRDLTDNDDTMEEEYTQDFHEYYRAKYYSGEDALTRWWVDMGSKALRHGTLSVSDRGAEVLPLRFSFQFYGHNISSVVITSGGFLYVGSYIHPFLSASQYIAPLMANFDLSDYLSYIKYINGETVFSVEWHGIKAKGTEYAHQDRFTFQVSIFNDSRIVFAYKEIPIPVDSLPASEHPVKVGVADAYYNDIYIAPKKIKRRIHQYHAVELDKSRIANSTAVVLEPLATCNTLHGCVACENSNIGFNCTWCEELNRCSDGFDRLRQEWVASNCETRTSSPCPLPSSETPTVQTVTSSPETDEAKPTLSSTGRAESTPSTTEVADIKAMRQHSPSGTSKSVVTASVLTIVIVLVVITVVGIWAGYAYKHPTTKSGQILIQLKRSRREEKNKPIIKYKYTQDGMSPLQEEGLCSLTGDIGL